MGLAQKKQKSRVQVANLKTTNGKYAAASITRLNGGGNKEHKNEGAEINSSAFLKSTDMIAQSAPEAN